MKLTAQEWTDFWKDLGENWYIDESTFPDFEDEAIPAIVEGDAWLGFQGRTREVIPSFIKPFEVEDGNSFSVIFRRWKKQRDQTSISFTIPNDRLREVTAALDKLGIRYTAS